MCKRWWWVFLVTAVVGPAGGVFVAGVVTYMMPKEYESQAVIEVRPAPGEMFSCDAEIKKIGGAEFLEIVASNLDLDSLWELPHQEVIERLRKAVKFSRAQDTNRIAISARMKDKFEAADIVNEFALSLKAERERFPQITAKRVAELNQQTMAQFDKLEDMAKQFRPNLSDAPADWRKISSQEWPELGAERQKYDALATELEAVAADAKAQLGTVIIHQAGVAPYRSVSPNVDFNLAVGKLLGLLFSPLFAVLIVWLLDRHFQPHAVAPAGHSRDSDGFTEF